MSFVDTVGPFVLCVLLGLAAVIAAVAFAAFVVSPRLNKVGELVAFNSAARRLVDDLIAETRTGAAVLPPYLTDDLFALKDNDINYHREVYR